MTIFIPAWINGTLAPVEKLEVHKRGLKHKAISVFVFCAGKLLIQQRASDIRLNFGLIHVVLTQTGAKAQKTAQADAYLKNLVLRTWNCALLIK